MNPSFWSTALIYVSVANTSGDIAGGRVFLVSEGFEAARAELSGNAQRLSEPAGLPRLARCVDSILPTSGDKATGQPSPCS